ncbi:hypothetical protein WJU23_08720 [Prosthecobacter sp. SYSU 5D2]|uniref:hypothetical protein n=1 Tax=Prosthecobacter sp. SYSU 5D2 TaxID=3134134 RepID=UPI0031FE578A
MFPPAPAAPATWQPMMPSGQSPFGIVPSHLPSAAEAGSQAVPYSPTPPAYVPSMQFAPRHDSAGGIGSWEVEYHPAPSWRPQREERNVPLGIFLLLVLGFGGWVLWGHLKGPLAVEFEAPHTDVGKLPGENDSVIPLEPAPAPAPLPQVAMETKDEAVSEPVSAVPQPEVMEPEIRRAGVPSEGDLRMQPAASAGLDLVRANEEAEALLQSLFKAETAAERSAVISQADEYQVEVEGFFERKKPKLKLLKLAAEMPRTLPGQEEVPLFLVLTDANPDAGALLRLVPQEGGGFLLDWPLFGETHERRLAGFLDQKSEQPSWFHVVLRRSHALDLPADSRSGQLGFRLHASADESVECLALVSQETPLGRYFEREVEWGSTHVARLLLQHRLGAAGEVGVVILDCEGAVTGAVFPGGGVKR